MLHLIAKTKVKKIEVRQAEWASVLIYFCFDDDDDIVDNKDISREAAD